MPCTCDRRGSLSDDCDPDDGQCRCKENFAGRFCSICKSGYYGFPECQKCRCNPAGVQSLSGRPNGECINEVILQMNEFNLLFTILIIVNAEHGSD